MNPHSHSSGHPSQQRRKLALLAWEMTRACGFACPHCRASALEQREKEELTTEEGKKLLREAANVGPGIIIMSGGEPLLREDLEELAAAGTSYGHTIVVACNEAHRLTTDRIRALKQAGVKRFSFSLHSHLRDDQDRFLGKTGAFDQAILAFGRLIDEGVSFQINTTVLPTNFIQLPEMLKFVESLRASAWHLFFVVCTGRAAEENNGMVLDNVVVEKVLDWTATVAGTETTLPIKVTCAPQYARIMAQKGKKLPMHGRSCMAGDGFAFVSSRGEVKPCGYFDVPAGSVRETPFDKIYEESPLFVALRDTEQLKGNCGACEYRKVCGGCRARAYAAKGDYLETDPSCRYTPKGTAKPMEDKPRKG